MIKIIDLQHFYTDGVKRQRFIQDLGSSLVETGFFILEGHEINQKLLSDAYSAAESFFLLPNEVKCRYEISELKGQRGFTSFGKEHAKNSTLPDLKEFWHVGQINNPQYLANIWPQEVPLFESLFKTLYVALEQRSLALLEACSLFLGESPTLLAEAAKQGNSILRIIHYPPIEGTPSSIRAGAHEDINLITLLPEATAGGLELLQRNGDWLPVRAQSGQIIVDSGDMLQNMTNGFYKSTTHRVINPNNSTERRFSMPFFVHPRSEADLSPLRSCVDKTGGNKLFPEITADEFLQKRLAEIGLK